MGSVYRLKSSTEELYGERPRYFVGMPYYRAVEEKIRLAKKQNRKYMEDADNACSYEEYAKAVHRLSKGLAAISYNTAIIAELRGDRDDQDRE